MNFEPKTEKQIQEERLLPEGAYDFEIIEATDETSKAGNDMIKIKMIIHHEERARGPVTDYLMPSFPSKLRHCCDSIGLLAEYEKGTLEAMFFVGLTGKVKLVIKEDKAGTYPPKNEVKDYVLRDAKIAHKPASGEAIKDEAPF